LRNTLTNIGIDLKEVRVVADEEAEIIAALDALRHRYNYVFTTGGIGPTHDDITPTASRKRSASASTIIRNGGAVSRALGRRRSERGAAAHGADSRRRRTDPERDHPGARLQDRQCHRHAGVPSIMQAMMDIVAPKAESGVRMLSESVRANAREGDIAVPCAKSPMPIRTTVIGSYPFQDEDKDPATHHGIDRARPGRGVAGIGLGYA